MVASNKKHQPHVKLGNDAEEEVTLPLIVVTVALATAYNSHHARLLVTNMSMHRGPGRFVTFQGTRLTRSIIGLVVSVFFLATKHSSTRYHNYEQITFSHLATD